MKSHLASSSTPSTENDFLLTRRQVAARWAVSLATIKRREAAGILHPLRFSRRMIRFKLTEVLAVERAVESA
jgi:hypothetical protein